MTTGERAPSTAGAPRRPAADAAREIRRAVDLSKVALRSFGGARDMPGVVELLTETNRHAGIGFYPTVESLTIDWSARPNFDPARDLMLAVAGDQIVGVARCSWREHEVGVVHRIEVWVRPDVQGQGLGRSLLAWGEQRSRAAVAEGVGGPAGVSHFLGAVTEESVTAGMALAVHAGYVPVRYHYEMRRDLAEPIPDPPPIPDGLELRPVVPEQHRAVWLADAEAFRDHWDASTMFEEDFVAFFEHPDVDTSLWLVAWDGDEVAGMVMGLINRHENEELGFDVGWVDGVSTRRPWRGRGLASALIPRSLRLLRERGMSVAAIGVDTENPSGALGLYQRFGFRPVKTWVFLRKPI